MIEPTVEPVVTDDAATVSPGLPAPEAAERLRDPAVPALVVLDSAGDVVGIASDSDFVALVAESPGSVPVEAIMSSPVRTVAPGTPLGLAADRMNEAGVKHLPVVEEGVYRGLVTLEAMAPFLSRNRLRVAWKGDPIHIDTEERSETAETDPPSDRAADS
ncbi:CBS domain protein [Natronomonas moolapensis 8.8.11]|uniref:CBS domain protein n=1 Tax=Natronomonas moolapensis (strain DSM 18674 / CECT 7526 / JCM 14361 / 8.8.11) TaxID=268739 RepID=M1XQA2_NATM8|nr:CBS domain-containing protein [Natronomonas moolapensis]CCQ36260.1 CBS domain protein [Natronomonas moolapensis 8.8.11]